MKKSWWWRWTVERPAAFGDWLRLMLVVLPADFLNRLTVRKIIALIPLAILIIAFAHHVPLPPEIVFLGDALAYLDILTIVLVLAAIARAGAILYFVRQLGENTAHRLARAIMPMVRRADSRHRRAVGALKRLARHLKKHDDEHGPISWGVPA
jgi:hypothetical protein